MNPMAAVQFENACEAEDWMTSNDRIKFRVEKTREQPETLIYYTDHIGFIW